MGTLIVPYKTYLPRFWAASQQERGSGLRFNKKVNNKTCPYFVSDYRWSFNTRILSCLQSCIRKWNNRHSTFWYTQVTEKLQAKKEASMKSHLEMPEPHAAIDAPMLAFCPATASVGRAPQIVSVQTYNETSHLWLSELRSSALRCLRMPWARNVRRQAVWLEWAYRFSPSHQVHARRFEQSCPEHVTAFQGWKSYQESKHFSNHY